MWDQVGNQNVGFLMTRLTQDALDVCCLDSIGRVARKPVFGVANQVRHKPGCSGTVDGQMLETWDSERRGIVLYVAKTKALISCAVTMHLWQKAGLIMMWLIQ